MNRNKKIIPLFIISLFVCGSFSADFVNNKERPKELSPEDSGLSSFGRVALASNEESNVVISEIQIGGESVYDEFIELYNPTDQEINLENWDLKRKTKSGTESNILNNIEGVIPAYGYFLIVPRANCGDDNNENCYKGLIIADDEYTTDSFLAKDNTVLLYNGDGNLINKIGWGEAGDFDGEVIINNPENNRSLERININGVVQDTDNNKNDFVLRDNPNPQNSDSDASQNGSTQENGAGEETHPINPPAPFDKEGYSQEGNKTEGNKIIITEFLPDPEDSDRDNEFIEIYNNGDAEVDLSGWTLEDKIGSVKKFIISDGVKIGAGKYKVFYSDETKITLNNSGDGVVLRDNKNNIIDETPASDSVQEEQSYALDENGSWILTLRPTPGRENIIKSEESRADDGNSDEQKDSTLTHPNPSQEGNQDNGASDTEQDGSTRENGANGETHPNPSQEGNNTTQDNGASAGYDYSDAIIISEVYPNPFGRDNQEGNYEWIELYNNSDEDVNLKGWQIDDILGKGSKAHTIEEDKIIKARNFAVFENIQTKIMLNNPGDEVNILWPGGEVVDSVRYEKASEGFSYNRTPDDFWIWSNEITPGKDNKTEAVMIEENFENNSERDFVADIKDTEGEPEEIEDMEIDYIETDIKDIKHFEKYSRIKISGVVSTPPGIFANNVFYLLGSGIQVYSYEVKIPKIELGDEIEITGRVSEAGGEKRMLLDSLEDIKILSRDNLTEARMVSTGNINESVEGYLVTAEGKVSQTKEDVFYLDDGSGEVKIYIKPQTGIEKPEIKKGDWMAVTGQVSRTSLGYRILPRFQGDVKLSKVSGISTAQASDISDSHENIEENKRDNFIFYSMLIIGLVILADWGRMRFKIKSKK